MLRWQRSIASAIGTVGEWENIQCQQAYQGASHVCKNTYSGSLLLTLSFCFLSPVSKLESHIFTGLLVFEGVPQLDWLASW
ncbi:hypothetical protein IQ270_09135 [Microcoleus sp. LEGE 07076]|uniref:hypothetical protein n=1 Tax=Microcoleus sp. LEGE 07076 TaxID=915322 RepID=UPI00187DE279|nr:hypothetical protein [Microcoleus sp. LEGE 07076]MBE9184870.1 hypothetical protein [Microcoleus sp. LEGE 07076]